MLVDLSTLARRPQRVLYGDGEPAAAAAANADTAAHPWSNPLHAPQASPPPRHVAPIPPIFSVPLWPPRPAEGTVTTLAVPGCGSAGTLRLSNCGNLL